MNGFYSNILINWFKDFHYRKLLSVVMNFWSPWLLLGYLYQALLVCKVNGQNY